MNILLWLAERRLPDFIVKKELDNLFRLTASVFDLEVPPLNSLTPDERLAEYARFTRDAVDRCMRSGAEPRDARERLFEKAGEYGRLWRRRFGVSTVKDVMRAATVLYRAMGIEFHGTEDGTIQIRRCLFSSYYTAGTCGLISSLDAGILAGLSGGGTLAFSRRITEGFDTCVATLHLKDATG